MRFVVLTTLLSALLTTGCGSLPGSEPNQRTYQLLPPDPPGLVDPRRLNATLVINRPTARPGYDGTSMAYRQSDYELRYFAFNRWSDRPARMLHGVLMTTLDQRGPFRHVVMPQSDVGAAFRLDVDLIRLEQDFRQTPSQARLALRVRMIDTASRTVLLDRTMEASREAPTDTPEGGVIAANRALADVLRNLSTSLRAAVETAPGGHATDNDS